MNDVARQDPRGAPLRPDQTTTMLSFRVRVTLLFGAIALAALSLLSFLLGGMLTEQALRERGESLQGIGASTAILLAEGLHERMREVQRLAGSSEAERIGLDAAGWRAAIDRLAEGRPHYAWIGVADAEGKVLSASRQMLVGADVSKRPWYYGARQGPYVGDVHPAKLLTDMLPAADDGEPLRFLDFAAPLRTARGEVVGVLGVHADWRWARDVIARVRRQDARNAGTLVYVLDRQRRVIHHPVGPDAQGSLVAGSPVPAGPAVLPWDDGQRYLTTGVPVVAFDALTDLGWTVVVRQPIDQALAPVASAQRTVWLAGGLVAALVMLSTWIIAGRISGPLADIAEAAEKIDAGDTHVAIPLSRRSSELERLSRSLSRMTQRLLARERELAEANQQLEARVAQRTAALAEANRHLELLAHQDGLTRLANRRSADLMLEKELAHHRRNRRSMAVLLADIDHFKRVNDTHGHAAGDDVLKAVALRLSQLLRHGDVAARFGGEEFLVILKETDAEGAMVVAEKIRASVEALTVPIVGRVTLSIGCAVAVEGRELSAALVKRADDALYEAKSRGRNRVCAHERAPAVAG